MAEYRARGIVVDAVQYNADGVIPAGVCAVCIQEPNEPHVHGMQGQTLVKVKHGDWIITEPSGTKRVYTPYDFEDAYGPA